MIIDILTLFPNIFKGPFEESMIKKAKEKGLVEINVHNLRKWSIDKRGTVDDRPYGGGKGMILRPEPIFDAVKSLKKPTTYNLQPTIILLSPTGQLFSQKKACQFAKKDHLILICGHYEGVDYRVHKYLADEVISIGDYVLTGGEIPAMVIVDSVVRLLPGVLEKEATKFESFAKWPKDTSEVAEWTPRRWRKKEKSGGVKKNDSKSHATSYTLLEYPQYTRPEVYKGHKVPKVLLSGNHQKIAKWRFDQAINRTKKLRPDLLR